ncbi:hypothetical protein MPSEU_000705200 [Mayamaea pseudoterrestris]|nr:hypothetical protein MPSEU_000705200 [Mayamaea pseudoterrestris]
MNVQRRNDVAIYCLSSGPTLPEWLGERARRNLSKKDENIRRRIELLQDFQMPAASSKLVSSNDGRYIIAAGTYPPRIRCYDLHELTMKFERYLTANVVDLCMLGEDYGKLALLQEDRTIAFHAPYGAHESVRIPTFGRNMAYEPNTCELIITARGNNLYRINLEEGRFAEPWSYQSEASSTCISISSAHPLAAVGSEDGFVRLWDSRASDGGLHPFMKLDVQSATSNCGYADEYCKNPTEITSIAHDPSGLFMAAGTAGGVVALYDVRTSKPLFVQEHKHGLPIHTCKFHPGSGMILSGDEKLVKAWRYKSAGDVVRSERFSGDASSAIGAVRVNVESTGGKLCHFIVAGDETDPHGEKSGLLLCATDQPKMESYYVPAVGTAPKWCSFLESITEELEERDLEREGADGAIVRDGQETVFENYKFVSREDVEKLGISNLVGTPLLRGYMHGFFMDSNLYNRVKAVANPFEYEEYQKKKLKERLEAKRSSRIAPRQSDHKKKSSVNAEMAERLQSKAEDSKSGKHAQKLLGDDRFGNLFTNPDFEIDQAADDFKLRNPSGIAAAKRKKNNLDSDDEDEGSDRSVEHGTLESHQKATVQSDDDDGQHALTDDEGSSSDSDGDGFGRVRGEAYEAMKAANKKKSTVDRSRQKDTRKQRKVKLIETDAIDADGLHVGVDSKDASTIINRRLDDLNMPLAKRLVDQEESDKHMQIKVTGGTKEARYVPKSDRKKFRSNDDGPEGRRKRRGVRELGFKTPFKNNRPTK